MKVTAKGSVILSAESDLTNVYKLKFFNAFKMTESHFHSFFVTVHMYVS